MKERQLGNNRKLFNRLDAYSLHVVSTSSEDKDNLPKNETTAEQSERKRQLLGDFNAFCRYYFSKYMIAEFGWFHHEAYEYILSNPNSTTVLEFPRGHAKSVLANILIPLYLKAKGELKGMILMSANQEKAIGLLNDLKNELVENARYVHDYGIQTGPGNWKNNSFTTRDGIGFWAFGIGQTPRGTRRRERRPNYGTFDDFDTDEVCANQGLVKEILEKMVSSTYPAFDLQGGSRIVFAQNRIHPRSILAHIVGDISEESIKNEAVKQIKVYAIEDPVTHEMDLKGTPAWKEYYTLEMLHNRFEAMRLEGNMRMVMKEYFHQYSTEGTVFKEAFIKDNYIDIEHYSNYELIVTYNDPSFKDTKKNDFKAIVAVGKLGSEFHVLDCWVQQDTTPAMVIAHYQIYDKLQNLGSVRSVHYMEANFLQSLHLDEYKKHGEMLGWHLPIRPDTRNKPDKSGRIENLTAFQGRIKFNRALIKNNSFQNLFEQLMNFPRGHDDGPDALEGAVFILNELGRTKQRADFGGERRVTDW